MDETNGVKGVGAEQVIRLDGGRFLNPDSALVHAALDLLATHVADIEGESTTLCAHCGLFYPCPTVQHARQVVNAGGLAKAADGADAAIASPARAEADAVEREEAETADDRFEVRDPVAAV
jgi:hypothetical protein